MKLKQKDEAIKGNVAVSVLLTPSRAASRIRIKKTGCQQDFILAPETVKSAKFY